MNMNASTTSDIDFLFEKTQRESPPERASRNDVQVSIDMLNMASPPKGSLNTDSFQRDTDSQARRNFAMASIMEPEKPAALE